MKTIILVRHAKSDWDNAALKDFERPLNERGKKDAPKMANRLKEKKININAFISSPAVRAKQTAELFIKEFGIRENEIIFIPELYHASVEQFYKTISAVDDSLNCIVIFSHNPGITDFVNELVKDVQLDNMPTCSMFGAKAKIENWKEFKDSGKEFLFFNYPKQTN